MTVGETQLVKLETLLGQLTEDMKAARKAAEEGLRQMDNRVRLLEGGVRNLEDLEVRRKTLEDERARVARLQEEQRQDEIKRNLSTKQFWVGTVLVCAATILAALIASGHLF